MGHTQHGVDKMQCPCTKCEGRGRLILLKIVKNHLVLNGRHPLFRVWKGPGPTMTILMKSELKQARQQ